MIEQSMKRSINMVTVHAVASLGIGGINRAFQGRQNSTRSIPKGHSVISDSLQVLFASHHYTVVGMEEPSSQYQQSLQDQRDAPPL